MFFKKNIETFIYNPEEINVSVHELSNPKCFTFSLTFVQGKEHSTIFGLVRTATMEDSAKDAIGILSLLGVDIEKEPVQILVHFKNEKNPIKYVYYDFQIFEAADG